MTLKSPPGLFITGTDTDVGKTYVTALIARNLVAAGRRVGVYKPVASGCVRQGDSLVSHDAETLWRAAGCPGSLEEVCPQRFAAPLAPHLAARSEDRALDPGLLRRGLEPWKQRSEIVLVEGVGGLMCPLTDDEYVADLAAEFGYPLVVVTRNALGTISHTLQTLITASVYRDGLEIAGLVLNHPQRLHDDPSVTTNRAELVARCVPPLLAGLAWGSSVFDAPVDWFSLARSPLALREGR